MHIMNTFCKKYFRYYPYCCFEIYAKVKCSKKLKLTCHNIRIKFSWNIFELVEKLSIYSPTKKKKNRYHFNFIKYI